MAEKNNFFREEAIKDTFFKPGTEGKPPQLMSIPEINQSSVKIAFEADEEEQKQQAKEGKLKPIMNILHCF
jgi:hypothetical protein